MKMRTLQTVVTLLAAAHVAGAAGMKMEKYIPYEATADEIAMTNIAEKVGYNQTFERPKNEAFRKRLDDALQMAQDEESRIRHMQAKGMVKKSYWNGLYTGSVIVQSEKAVYSFSLGATGEKLGQVDKTVYVDKPYGKEKKKAQCCSFVFHDNADSVSSFSYGQGEGKVTLNFHPKNQLASCGLTIGEEYYRAQWDENGKLVSETRRKIEK